MQKLPFVIMICTAHSTQSSLKPVTFYMILTASPENPFQESLIYGRKIDVLFIFPMTCCRNITHGSHCTYDPLASAQRCDVQIRRTRLSPTHNININVDDLSFILIKRGCSDLKVLCWKLHVLLQIWHQILVIGK